MRFGLHLPTTGPYADVRLLAAFARAAEAAGWDGFFLYDQVADESAVPLADPWIGLTACALATEHIRLGTLVTPLARRRVWKVAREIVTLDHLSGGRMVLGVGLGAGAAEFDNLGEATDPKERAALLDEGLAVIDGLWRGAPLDFTGERLRIAGAHFLPVPVQQPRVPIWVGGIWPNRAPMRRAARWDGVFPHNRDGMMPAAELAALAEFVRAERASDAPFDLVVRNKLGPESLAQRAELLPAYAAAGLTWWLEGVESAPTPAALRALIEEGPPNPT